MGSGYTVAALLQTYTAIHQLAKFTFNNHFGQVVILSREKVSVMKLTKKNKGMFAKVLMYGAAASILFSIIGWLGQDIWLASTQWLLIAAVMALFGIYFSQK